MPLKSPGKVLKLWKNAGKAYLEKAKVKEMEPQEEFLNKKIVKGLERLRGAAAKKDSVTAEEFHDMRDDTANSMDKFRKLLKPKKAQDKVKAFYKSVCRMTLVVESLTI